MFQPRITVTVGSLTFQNPILLASGPLSKDRESISRAAERGFGGVVAKTVTREPSEGNPKPRWAFQDYSMVAADGLPNPGCDRMSETVFSLRKDGLDIPLIGSIAGTSPEEYAKMAFQLQEAGADGIELNLVCPHRGRLVGRPTEEPLGQYWSMSSERVAAVVTAVRKTVDVPVWVKFPSERSREVVRAMEAAGADALVPFPGPVHGMVIDVEKGKPVLGNIEGSGTITGAALKPLGIKSVSDLSRWCTIPVVGTGGVGRGLDVVEYLYAGARSVQVLTAVMRKTSVERMLLELNEFMERKGFAGLADMCGLASKTLPPSV